MTYVANLCRLSGLYGLFIIVATSALNAYAQAEEPPRVNFYNWNDYIAANTLPDFTKETGIQVTYDVFDTNEVLEAKLFSGNTGFDIVVPGSDFMARQIIAGVFLELDKSKIPNYANLDPRIMQRMANSDPGNRYGIPYMWGTTGIGYNVDKVRAALGDNTPLDSWDLVLKPENLAKLSKCGVAFMDNPTEVFATVLHYLGKDPNSLEPTDYSGAATDLLLSLRPHITYFHASKYINDLANGDVCVAVGWSGDILQAKDRAQEANNKVNITYFIPKEGALMWFDVMTIPKDARHPNNAHKLLDYLLRPEVMGANSNVVSYANAVPASKKYISPEIANDPSIFPPDEVADKLFTTKVLPHKLNRVLTRAWTRVRTGH